MQKREAQREGEHCCAVQTRTGNNGSSWSELSTLRYYYGLNTSEYRDTEISPDCRRFFCSFKSE